MKDSDDHASRQPIGWDHMVENSDENMFASRIICVYEDYECFVTSSMEHTVVRLGLESGIWRRRVRVHL